MEDNQVEETASCMAEEIEIKEREAREAELAKLKAKTEKAKRKAEAARVVILEALTGHFV